MCGEPGAILDDLGQHEKFMRRVAVKKTDLLTLREAHIQSKGYKMAEKEKKNATQSDVDKLDSRMQKGEQHFSVGAG